MIFLYIAIIVAVPVLAEVIRAVVLGNIELGGSVGFIPGILNLTNTENRGVAFGWFQNGTVFFAVTTGIVIVIASIFLIRNYKKSKLFSVSLALIIGGGLGNLFERVVYGYVTDYLSLTFFPPVCNFADYCITAGTVCLIVYLLFFSDFMKSDKKKDKKDAEV